MQCAITHGLGEACPEVHVSPLLHPSRRRGGLAEERAERQRWTERERQRIMDSVRGECLLPEMSLIRGVV